MHMHAFFTVLSSILLALSVPTASAARQALEFDGKQGHISATLSVPLDGDLTLEAWVCTAAQATLQQRIIGLWGADGALQMCINGGRYLMDNSGGPETGLSGPAGHNDGRWHHVVIKRYEKTTYALHVDGVAVGSCAGTTPAYTSVYMGLSPAQPRFNGYIDEVRVYDRCLTDREVRSNYSAADAAPVDGLVAWWKLDGDVKDAVGENHGSIVGAPAWVPGRGEAVFDRPRVHARFHPGAGKVSVEVDARLMGQFPPGSSWELALNGPDGAVVAGRRISPMPPACEGEVSLPVPRPVPGRHTLSVRVADTAGKRIGEDATAEVMLAERPPWTAEVKLLNNLVMELLSVTGSPANRAAPFLNPRDGWCFFSVTAEEALTPGQRIELRLHRADMERSIPVVALEDGGSAEAMRFLRAGTYALDLTAAGQARVASVVVRAVPEIIFAEFMDNPRLPQYGAYDMAFMRRTGMLDNINTIEGDANFRNALHPYCAEWQAQGKRWIAERTIGTATTPKAAYEFWMFPLLVTQPRVDGIMIDEFMQFTPMRTEAVRQMLADPRFSGKLFYPYVCSPSPKRGGEEGVKFIRLVMDSGNRVVWERYLQEQPDPAAAWAFLDMTLRREMKVHWLEHLPDPARHMVMCFGNYISAPGSTLNADPSVDFKVWMDMQYNLIVNDPLFFGLYGIMEWSSGAADEEYIRWASRLYRHYAIEGRTDMLSPEYGFRYKLTHVRNPDFSDRLEGWKVDAAEDGSVEAHRFNGYSALQGRYPRTTQGDSFLCMRRSASAPNAISQQVKDLVPGRLYSFKMYTGDYRALREGKSAEEKHAVSVRIDNVDPVPAKCYQALTKKSWYDATGAFSAENPFWSNFHARLFRARNREATLTISDWLTSTDPGGPAGRELAFNFIEIQPYLEK